MGSFKAFVVVSLRGSISGWRDQHQASQHQQRRTSGSESCPEGKWTNSVFLHSQNICGSYVMLICTFQIRPCNMMNTFTEEIDTFCCLMPSANCYHYSRLLFSLHFSWSPHCVWHLQSASFHQLTFLLSCCSVFGTYALICWFGSLDRIITQSAQFTCRARPVLIACEKHLFVSCQNFTCRAAEVPFSTALCMLQSCNAPWLVDSGAV